MLGAEKHTVEIHALHLAPLVRPAPLDIVVVYIDASDVADAVDARPAFLRRLDCVLPVRFYSGVELDE